MSENNTPPDHTFLLGQIDAKIKMILEMLERTNATFAAHETRIRALEHGRSWLIGAAAVAGAVVSFLVKLFI